MRQVIRGEMPHGVLVSLAEREEPECHQGPLSSRSEEGCIEYGYAEDVSDPGLIYVKEMWTDQESLDRHFASSHIAEWRAAWSSLGIGDRDLRVYDVAEPRRT